MIDSARICEYLLCVWSDIPLIIDSVTAVITHTTLLIATVCVCVCVIVCV